MKFLIVTILTCITGLYGCATRGDVDTLDERLYMLEQKSLTFEKQDNRMSNAISSGNKLYQQSNQKLRDQAAMLSAEMGRLREELQISRGVVEETDFSLKKKLETIENIEGERNAGLEALQYSFQMIKERVARIERYLNLEVVAEDKPPETPLEQPASSATLKTDLEMYQAAKKALDNGNAETARQKFQTILTRFPKSSHADNAQFWIGEIFYREKWYEKAILEYQKVIEKYKTGNKIPAALLKQGLSFYHLNDKANSRLILRELIKKYPTSNEAQVARKKLNEF